MFGGLTQQVDSLQRDLRLAGWDQYAALLEGFQDSDPEISGYVAAGAQIDIGIKFEGKALYIKVFKIVRRCWEREDTGMVLCDLE